MKFPFTFSIKLIFRLTFPGMILTAALFPASEALLTHLGLSWKSVYTFPFEVVGLGWAIVVCDKRIYMLLEGRRYWPYPIRWCFTKLQQMRLNRLRKIVYSGTKRRRISEAGVEYGQYPVNDNGDSYAEFPTRLGNLIRAYEEYPAIKYRLDSVFFWPRLWVIINKDLREDIDNIQAVTDSAVYISFSMYLAEIIIFVYDGIIKVQHTIWSTSWLSFVTNIYFLHVPYPQDLISIGFTCLIFGFTIYRLTLPIHATFGELFKAVFDMHHSKLNLEDVVSTVSEIVKDLSIMRKPINEKNKIAWLYLRWHRIKAPNGFDYTPRELRELEEKKTAN